MDTKINYSVLKYISDNNECIYIVSDEKVIKGDTVLVLTKDGCIITNALYSHNVGFDKAKLIFSSYPVKNIDLIPNNFYNELSSALKCKQSKWHIEVDVINGILTPKIIYDTLPKVLNTIELASVVHIDADDFIIRIAVRSEFKEFTYDIYTTDGIIRTIGNKLTGVFTYKESSKTFNT